MGHRWPTASTPSGPCRPSPWSAPSGPPARRTPCSFSWTLCRSPCGATTSSTCSDPPTTSWCAAEGDIQWEEGPLTLAPGSPPQQRPQLGEQLAATGGSETLTHPRDVVFHRLRGNEQLCPGLLVGHACQHEFRDFDLALAQRRDGSGVHRGC